MGFDDSIHENDIIQKTLESTKSVRTYYVPDEITIEFMKESEEERLYNGYSLAFHMVYSVYFVEAMGSCPRYPSEELIKIWKKKVRKMVLLAVLESKMEEGCKNVKSYLPIIFPEGLGLNG